MTPEIQKLLDTAKAELGYKEGKNNDNKYGKAFGMNNVSWCMEFVWWVHFKSGNGGYILKTAGCEALEAWAKKNKLTVPVAKIQAGDILLYDFYKEGKSVHVGIAVSAADIHTHLVPAYEGNTAPEGGSQVNGDGVYLKHRSPTVIRTVVRLKRS